MQVTDYYHSSASNSDQIIVIIQGDPLKDTSGPALNIVMKLMAIISLVFANYFYAINEGILSNYFDPDDIFLRKSDK